MRRLRRVLCRVLGHRYEWRDWIAREKLARPEFFPRPEMPLFECARCGALMVVTGW